MIAAYPWGALEPLSLGSVRASARARKALRASSFGVAAALGQLLELPCEVVLKRSQLGRVPERPGAVWLAADALVLGAAAEPALLTFLAARLLRRAEPLTDPREPLSPPLAGLLAALGVETARRIGVATTLVNAPPHGEEVLLCDVALLVEGRPFTLALYVLGATTNAAPAPPALAALGRLELTLPLVIASVVVDRRELAELEPGGALLLGETATLPAPAGTRGVLVAPHGERGIQVELGSDGRLVLGETCEARLSVEREPSTSQEAESLTDVLLDAPVVVRVELGAVSMSAREWAELGPGDVIETAQRIAEPVVLRVAGREVGRGELVNVDGQVGVRIQKLFGGT